uniref:Uncharacterized protein n=1 Tax=Panagrellus redivivus TaxID=6233 RepID=A0A7E4UVJ9_PANRE
MNRQQLAWLQYAWYKFVGSYSKTRNKNKLEGCNMPAKTEIVKEGMYVSAASGILFLDPTRNVTEHSLKQVYSSWNPYVFIKQSFI